MASISPPNKRLKRSYGRKTNSIASAKSTYYQSNHPLFHRVEPDIGSNQEIQTLRCPSSPLERLPPEILDHIFSFCLSANLPRASPYISAKLSDSHTYVKFFSAVFCYVTNHSGQIWSVLPESPEADSRELVRARNQALNFRWMTWSTFKRLSGILLEREFTRLNGTFSPGSSIKNVMEPQHCTAPHFANLKKRKFFLKNMTIYLGDKCRIPSKLLQSPMRDENSKFIQALSHLGARVDPMNSLGEELVRDLWRDALSNENWSCVDLIMRPAISPKVSLDNISSLFLETKCSLKMLRYIAYNLGYQERSQVRVFIQSISPEAMAEVTRRVETSARESAAILENRPSRILGGRHQSRSINRGGKKITPFLDEDVIKTLYPTDDFGQVAD